ncbi:MAG: DUF1501 domain-containing protein [Planctomycetaceae bacterium]|nr:DUF1501 domain-containing protein [Planctomycetaceae bacterium]
MLTITRPSTGTKTATGHLPRRVLLQAGLFAPLGMASFGMAPATARASTNEENSSPSFGRAKRCIFIFLNGGPSQLDTWDMKPHAPANIRGELQPIPTKVPGIDACELLPRMAMLTDRFKIVRSVTHTASVHTTGVYTMLTGTYHRTPKVDQTVSLPEDHPHLGSVVSHHHGWTAGSPPFITLPTLFRAPPVEGVWPGQTAGFLGRRFDPFVIEGEKQTAKFRFTDVETPPELSAARLTGRRDLLTHLTVPSQKETAAVRTWNEIGQQAWSLLESRNLRRIGDLESEPVAVRDRYGRHLFGQGLLLARKLSESGIPFVTVYWIDPTPAGAGGGEYDSHGFIYKHMRERLLPPTDMALSALFEDLRDRGLDEETLVVVLSEFGRTPMINKDAGRDHWAEAQSILMAGAGITGGVVHGATDQHAAYPSSDPVTPPDLGQSILHLLGVPSHLELRDPQGRPFLASQGRVDQKLIG